MTQATAKRETRQVVAKFVRKHELEARWQDWQLVVRLAGLSREQVHAANRLVIGQCRWVKLGTHSSVTLRAARDLGASARS